MHIVCDSVYLYTYVVPSSTQKSERDKKYIINKQDINRRSYRVSQKKCTLVFAIFRLSKHHEMLISMADPSKKSKNNNGFIPQG